MSKSNLRRKHPEPPCQVGVAALTRAAYQGADMTPFAALLENAIASNPENAGAYMDLALVEQLRGDPVRGRLLQARALRKSRLFRTHHDRPTFCKLLALAAPVEMGNNTPLDFLLARAPITLETLYVSPDLPMPDTLPEHDVAMVIAPGDSDSSRKFLAEIAAQTQHWPGPVLNQPDRILRLDRAGLCRRLGQIPGLTIPATQRLSRRDLSQIAAGMCGLTEMHPDLRFPVLLRPVGAHAGRNLARLTSASAIADYLIKCSDTSFFVSNFMPYQSNDGLHRKYRIVFIDGRAYPVHMAIGADWKLWYLNAEMDQSAPKRQEEKAFLTHFNQLFGHRHRRALDAIATSIGLDYFGIDCAEDPSGNLLLFEADNTLIVHDMDPQDLFPYKGPAMRKIFKAFARMIHQRAGLGRARQTGPKNHYMP